MNPTPVILVAGPTASGKSALALEIARRHGGELINADAVQLYRDLRILSARPSEAEEAETPHHLYGIADAADGWSAGRWLKAALKTIDEVRGRGRMPIVVGGTGLYFTALTRGLAPMPASHAESRAAAAADFDRMGETAFRRRLETADPEAAARITPGDRQRLVRAWEVFAESGRSLSDWRGDTSAPLSGDDWRGLVLEPDRAALYARCDLRFDAMLAAGAVQEVEALLRRDIAADAPAMKAVGLREIVRHVTGELSLAEAAELARRETRRYAKRQATWFRNQTPDWPRARGLETAAQWKEADAQELFARLPLRQA